MSVDGKNWRAHAPQPRNDGSHPRPFAGCKLFSRRALGNALFAARVTTFSLRLSFVCNFTSLSLRVGSTFARVPSLIPWILPSMHRTDRMDKE